MLIAFQGSGIRHLCNLMENNKANIFISEWSPSATLATMPNSWTLLVGGIERLPEVVESVNYQDVRLRPRGDRWHFAGVVKGGAMMAAETGTDWVTEGVEVPSGDEPVRWS